MPLTIIKRCRICNQPIKVLEDVPDIKVQHFELMECVAALARKIDELESENQARKLIAALARNSDPPK